MSSKLLVVALVGCLAALPGCEKKPVGQPTGTDGTAPAGAKTAETTAPGAAISAPTGTSSFTGSVKVNGSPPAPQPVNMAAKPECSAHANTLADNLVVSADKGLKQAVVFVKKGLEKYKFDPPKEPAVLDQKGCMYVPHVFGIMVNQDLKIHSSDNFLHNVNNKDNNLNLAFPAAGREELKPKVFKKEGPSKFQCEVHPWMSAYAYVSKTPYFAVTGEDGKYEIKGLPAGKYTLGVWHEAYPGLKAPADIEVEVAGGEAKTQDFVFDFK